MDDASSDGDGDGNRDSDSDGDGNRDTDEDGDGDGNRDSDEDDDGDEDGEEDDHDDESAKVAKKHLERRLKHMDVVDKKLCSFPGGPRSLSIL